ncbi:MAG: hypothetical protein QOE67_680, partial [Solirubrobacteraceae bacterium]|nr:hypothetical protein [Solirubrobacteraceae bacterium]
AILHVTFSSEGPHDAGNEPKGEYVWMRHLRF